MKIIKQRIIERLFLLIAVAAVMVGSGCATNRLNLVKDGTVFVEIVPTRNEYITRTSIYQDNGEVLITGNVGTHRLPVFANGGHVDGVILAPDGSVIKKFSASHAVFRRKNSFQPAFTVRLPLVLQPKTAVCLAYHHPATVVAKTFDCGQNAAAPHYKAGS